MRARDRELVEDVVSRIIDGEEVSRADVLAMLILLRESAPRKSALRDLGDAAAHRDRNRGGSFDYLNKLAKKFRIIMTHGARKFTTDSLMPMREVMRELNAVLRMEGIAGKFGVESHALQCRLSDVLAHALDETEFALFGASGKLSYSEEGWGHTAAIAQNDDITRADGNVIEGGIWIAMEWLNPEEHCTEACTHRRPRI